jgi:peptidoglycan/LPS O-acetylase OafA/YrhL
MLVSPSRPSPFRFLLNRCLRLFPALCAAVIATYAINRLQGGPPADWFVLFSNLFTLNWLYIERAPPIMTVTWSLFWEWVFYFSAALIVLSGRVQTKFMKPLILALTLFAVVVLLFVLGGRSWTYVLLFAAGSLLSLVRPFAEFAARPSWGLVFTAYLVLVNTYAWLAPAHAATQSARFAAQIEPHSVFVPLFAIVASALVVKLFRHDFQPQVTASRYSVVSVVRALFGWIGTRSYSIYLWHMPAVFLLSSFAKSAATLPVDQKPLAISALILAALLLTVAASEASYRLFEQPYLRSGARRATGRT